MSSSAVEAQTDPSRTARVELTLRAIQQHIGANLAGDPETVIVGVNALETAQPGELTFADHSRYLPQVRASRASACIVAPAFPDVKGMTLLRVYHPRLAFIKALYLFQVETPVSRGVHRQAVVAPDAQIGEDVTIGECAVVRSRARIGRGTVIESGVHIGEDVSIGEQGYIGPNVVITHGCQIGNRVRMHGGVVIGADGFGYVWMDGRQTKIPQLGDVIIEDDVELGANVCVDRATFGSTIIKRGAKLDNLVQIAHNDVIGEHVTMAGQVGLAGSVRVGNRVVLAGQVGVGDHVTIGDDVRIGAKSAVFRNVPSGQVYWGSPARQIQKTKRELAALAFLPELLKKMSRFGPSRRRPMRRTRDTRKTSKR